MVANGHQFVTDDVALQATVETVRAYPGSRQPPFSTLDEARVSFQDTLYPQDFPVTYVGDTVVDVVLLFTEQGSTRSYQLSSSLNPGLPGQEKTANLILDYYPGSVEVFRGQLSLGLRQRGMRGRRRGTRCRLRLTRSDSRTRSFSFWRPLHRLSASSSMIPCWARPWITTS